IGALTVGFGTARESRGGVAQRDFRTGNDQTLCVRNSPAQRRGCRLREGQVLESEEKDGQKNNYTCARTHRAPFYPQQALRFGWCVPETDKDTAETRETDRAILCNCRATMFKLILQCFGRLETFEYTFPHTAFKIREPVYAGF
ncbi:MAG: hypothetical protein WB993_14685, partial [Candidatus Sulfotelmatobacter sp.]